MKSTIQLEYVCVENLFGRLAYKIDFKTGANVAIVLAPNGCGKTSLFKLINFIFNPDFEGFNFARKIPFSRCTCRLSNGNIVELVRNERRRMGFIENSDVYFELELRLLRKGRRASKYFYFKEYQKHMMHRYDQRWLWRCDVAIEQESI